MTLACPAAVALAIVAILLLIPGASAGRQGQTTPDAVAWLVVEHIFDGQSLAFIAAAARKSISTVKRYRGVGFGITGTSQRLPARAARCSRHTRLSLMRMLSLLES